MSKQYRWERREQRQNAKKNRMPKSGKSVFIIQSVLIKKGGNNA